MQTYTPPLRDMRFVLYELHNIRETLALPGYEEVTPDLIDAVLDEAARFLTEIVFPLNVVGDREGCTFENGVVRTPPGFREAFNAYREGGWTYLGMEPEEGGQVFPEVAARLFDEMAHSANIAFMTYPGLARGVHYVLSEHASPELKGLYLPKLAGGVWGGAMCLTEAHCGSDLGLLRSRAAPRDDGSFAISGSKIFITAGEHDLTENIVYLVLARLPDAPAGTKGISLFLVPKFLPTADGAPGVRNGVACAGIEHKMGLNGSATCQMVFEAATGWLVGEPHRGMRGMFTLMNMARLACAIDGVAIGEVAYQSAVAYARERLQGRAPGGPKHPDKPADPIIVHPEIRRSLMTMRAINEGGRALLGWIAAAEDRLHRSPDPTVKQEAGDFVALMTPIAKALLTDLCSENANRAVQIYGGHGYIRDHGVEQLIRDARIGQIYEGTSAIQALDLVGRKLPEGGGRLLRQFFVPISSLIAAYGDDPVVGPMTHKLAKAFETLQNATSYIAAAGTREAEEAAAGASEYLRLFGLVVLGYLWLRMAKVAADKVDTAGADTEFYRAKTLTARFYMDRILPETISLWETLSAGKETLMALDELAF